jgi:hypothetical protein
MPVTREGLRVNRLYLFVILGLVVLLGVLGTLGVIPLGLGGDEDHTPGGVPDLLEAEGPGGATLEGRGARPVGPLAVEEPQPLEPAVAAEVRGTTRGGAVVRGRVVREQGGVPLAGVTVRLARPDSIIEYLRAPANGRFDELEASTAADGRFAFLDVTPSKGYVVRAYDERFAVASTPDELDLRGREAVDVGDLKMGPGGALVGRVVSATKVPVADVRVVATWRIANPLGVILSDPDTAPELEKAATTDGEGRFRIDLLDPSPKTLFAVAPSGAAQVVRSVTVEAGKTNTVDDIVLPGAGFLAGRVQWKDGTPIADARVFAAPMGGRSGATRSTVTDATGAFHLPWLPQEASLGLGVLVQGLPVRMTMGVSTGRDDILVEFDMPGRLEGRVVRADGGAPVTRFFIELEDLTPSEDWQQRFVRTQVQRGLGPAPFEDPAGTFEMPRVAPGRYVVRVTAPGFPEVRKADVAVVAGETTAVVIEIPVGNVARGHVFAAAGAAVTGARLYVVPAGVVKVENPVHLLGAVDDLEPDTATRGDGSFELPPQTPGLFDVVAAHPDTLPGILRGVDLRAGDVRDLEIRLPPSGTVTGRLLDEHGRPVTAEEVYVLYRDGTVVTERVEQDGRFEVRGLPVGRCVVRWMSMRDSARYAAPIRGGSAEEKDRAYDELRQDGGEHELVDGETVEVSLRLPRLVVVRGRMTVAGAPDPELRGAWLQMPGAHTWIRLACDEHGRFEKKLEPGRYDVWIEAGGQWRQLEVEIPDEPAYQFDIDVP